MGYRKQIEDRGEANEVPKKVVGDEVRLTDRCAPDV